MYRTLPWLLVVIDSTLLKMRRTQDFTQRTEKFYHSGPNKSCENKPSKE